MPPSIKEEQGPGGEYTQLGKCDGKGVEKEVKGGQGRGRKEHGSW